MKHNISLPLAKAFIHRAAALGYEVKMADAQHDPKLCMTAYLGQQEICNFEMSGAARYYPDNPLVQERRQLQALLMDMKQAHDLYADAKPLDIDGVREFRLISEFDNAVLAAKMSKDDEVRFTTWQYTYDRTGVTMGHYYETNYEGAKKDFALRAGLVQEQQFFTTEELTVLHDACIFRGQNDDTITFDDEQKLNAVMEKVEDNLPQPLFTPAYLQNHEQEDEHGI